MDEWTRVDKTIRDLAKGWDLARVATIGPVKRSLAHGMKARYVKKLVAGPRADLAAAVFRTVAITYQHVERIHEVLGGEGPDVVETMVAMVVDRSKTNPSPTDVNEAFRAATTFYTGLSAGQAPLTIRGTNEMMRLLLPELPTLNAFVSMRCTNGLATSIITHTEMIGDWFQPAPESTP